MNSVPESAGQLQLPITCTIYKGTTLPHIVVKRKLQLTAEGVTTYQLDRSPSGGKAWLFHRKTILEPAVVHQIRIHERHLRKAGPLRALSAYARDKNVLKLYCFRVEWPEKYAPAHGSTLELGFESLAEARQWYGYINSQIAGLGHLGTSSISRQYSLTNGLYYSSCGLTSADMSLDPSPFTSPVDSHPGTPHLLSKQPSSIPDTASSPTPLGVDGAAPTVVLPTNHRRCSSAADVRSSQISQPNRVSQGAGAGQQTDSRPGSAGSSSTNLQQQQQSVGSLAAAMHRVHQSSGGTSSTGVVVDECMVRWVPYKHANGMAIYYRQTPQEEGMPQASGEYMLSTAVQATPDCCVSNLMLKADKNGSFLSTAAFMEVLEDNGDMQVWHMVFHPAGSAGLATVLAAPRYTFLHQVLTSYEEGVYAVLFNSVPDEDVKPEWLERANARTKRAHRAVLRSDPGSGSRKPLWQTPVRCNITGAITLSALEGRTGRESPQTLVTCIVRADFGGWLSSKSMFYGLGQALGLQEALLDRVLMRVMILKEDVEYSRFKTKPFQLLMLQPEEYDPSSESNPQDQHASIPTHRNVSAPTACSAATGADLEPAAFRSGSSAPGRTSLGGTAAAAAAGAAAVAAPAPPPAGSSALGPAAARAPASPGAVAVAAARVSAAASALAAHMTNPQQLWHEKRGSSAGLSVGPSAANTPPQSPPKQGAVPSPFGSVSPRQKHHRSSDAGKAAAGVLSSAGVVAITTSAGMPVRGHKQHEPLATKPSSGELDRFYSVTDTAAGIHQQQAGSTSSLLSAVSGGSSEEEEGAANGTSRSSDISSSSEAAAGLKPSPYSDEQLDGMINGTLQRKYWESIHDGPGSIGGVYSIRGPSYLKDRKKIPAGRGRYKLMAADLVATHHMMDHIGRFLPSVRCSGAAFSFVVDLIINYGNPVLHLVMVFATDKHPNSLGPCPDDPLDAGDDWTPFDFTMARFLHGTDEERNGMFKLIPHCAKGSWVVSQSVGTTPVILGRKLATTYHLHDRYIEVDVDVASTPAVSYIVKMVQGATKSMLIDHAYLLESQYAHELPETLIGAIRYKHLDMTDYTFVQVEQELPFSPVLPNIVGQ